MTHETHLRVAGAVILIGLLALSSDLRWAWQHSPFDRGGAWIFAAWIGLAVWTGGRSARPVTAGLAIALGLGLISVVGELNVARHAALAVLVGAWMPGWFARSVITLCGVAWWPALGWGVTQFMEGPFVIWVRIALLMAGGVMIWWRRPEPPNREVTL